MAGCFYGRNWFDIDDALQAFQRISDLIGDGKVDLAQKIADKWVEDFNYRAKLKDEEDE